MTHLLNSIEQAIKNQTLGYSKLSEEEAEVELAKLKEAFRFDYKVLHLWGHNWENREICEYGEGWGKELSRYLKDFADCIYLVVTDDEFYPWVVYYGEKRELKGLLEEQRFFEYFVFDHSCKKVLFDTHHNSLILFRR
ncbi:MAG: hypothetical protein AAFZ15_27595 [Bacteroidota bacterium]